MASTKYSKLIETVTAEVEESARILRETGSLSASNIGFAFHRVSGEDKLVAANFPGLWKSNSQIVATVVGFDGTVYDGDSQSGGAGAEFGKIFIDRPEINTVIHAHTPYLATWANAHRVFPILYVAAQRHTLAREIPVYIDRRVSQASFISEQLKANPHLPAILEGNGGATFWGDGITKTAQYIILLEEAARFQTLAEAIGGSKEYGPGVLEQQWKMTGLKAA
jgi:L-ribulose-5-phosphate 4-epimerase